MNVPCKRDECALLASFTHGGAECDDRRSAGAGKTKDPRWLVEGVFLIFLVYHTSLYLD